MVKTQNIAYNSIRGDIMFAIFNAVIRPAEDAGGYYAVCDMMNGGCTAQNETIQKTQKDILEAVSFYLEDYPEISDYYVNFEVRNA